MVEYGFAPIEPEEAGSLAHFVQEEQSVEMSPQVEYYRYYSWEEYMREDVPIPMFAAAGTVMLMGAALAAAVP